MTKLFNILGLSRGIKDVDTYKAVSYLERLLSNMDTSGLTGPAGADGAPGAAGSTGAAGAPGLSTAYAMFGNGQDGALVYDGVTTVLGMAPAAGVYTLTRTIYATDMTVSAGVRVRSNGCMIFGTGTLLLNGQIDDSGDGGFAAGNTATGALRIATWFGPPGSGGAGGFPGTASGNTTSTLPVPFTQVLAVVGPSVNGGLCQGGGGGSSSIQLGGNGGSINVASTANGGPIVPGCRPLSEGRVGQGAALLLGYSTGGGGGGSSAANGGGAGHGGGHCSVLFQILAGSGSIRADGGNGSAGGPSLNASGGGGGGGGGGAGLSVAVYRTNTGSVTLVAAGGTGGAGGAAGFGGPVGGTGGNGGNGVTLRFNISGDGT